MAHSFFLTVCIPIPIPVDELIIVPASCCPCHDSSSQTPDFRPKKRSKTVLIALKIHQTATNTGVAIIQKKPLGRHTSIFHLVPFWCVP